MNFAEAPVIVLFVILIAIRFATEMVRLVDAIQEVMCSLDAPVEKFEAIYGRGTGGNEGMETTEGLAKLSGQGEEYKED